MPELSKEQQSKLSTVLMEYLNANDWKGLFAETQCEAFPQQHTQFYEDLSWDEENLDKNCAAALDYILTKNPENLKFIWELPGVQTMTKRKDESLELEIQALIEGNVLADNSLTQMFTHFQSERLQARPICKDDAEFMFENWTQELDIAKYMTWKPHQEIQETNNFIDTCTDDWDKNTYTWILESKQSKEILGSFAARRNEYKLDVGYLLIKEAWGKGYMTEIMEAFIEEAFKVEGVLRIGAVCDVENPASKRVMEKAGMSFEGLLKKWLIHPNMGDTPRDCFCLSIVKNS